MNLTITREYDFATVRILISPVYLLERARRFLNRRAGSSQDPYKVPAAIYLTSAPLSVSVFDEERERRSGLANQMLILPDEPPSARTLPSAINISRASTSTLLAEWESMASPSRSWSA